MTYYKCAKTIFSVQQSGNLKLNIAIILGLSLLSAFYLWQVNGAVEKNFELRSAQNFLKEKQEIKQRGIVSLMGAQSLVNLEGAAKTLNLVSIDKVGYLSILPFAVAFSPKP